VIHIYEIEGHGIYWEVYKQGIEVSDDLILSIYTPDTLEWYLDKLHSDGLNFIYHSLEEMVDA
jgi:hypothetical protein